MREIRCDLCKKKIKGKPITAGVGLLSQVELCEKCGAPILKFLKKHKFIESEKIKRNKTKCLDFHFKQLFNGLFFIHYLKNVHVPIFIEVS